MREPTDKACIGATRNSSSTAELSTLYWALEEALFGRMLVLCPCLQLLYVSDHAHEDAAGLAWPPANVRNEAADRLAKTGEDVASAEAQAPFTRHEGTAPVGTHEAASADASTRRRAARGEQCVPTIGTLMVADGLGSW